MKDTILKKHIENARGLYLSFDHPSHIIETLDFFYKNFNYSFNQEMPYAEYDMGETPLIYENWIAVNVNYVDTCNKYSRVEFRPMETDKIKIRWCLLRLWNAFQEKKLHHEIGFILADEDTLSATEKYVDNTKELAESKQK